MKDCRSQRIETHLNPDRQFLLEHIRFGKRITKAKGHYLYDEYGRRYLDFLAQYGSVPFGHNPDFLWDAITDVRAREEPSLVQPLLSPAAERLAQELIAVAPEPLRYVTFTNSGAEAVEAAIKLCRAKTRRPVVLTTHGGFHGKTLGALSATGNPIYRQPFLVDTTHFEQLPFNDLDELEGRLAEHDVAAFIVEPVQGEGGMREPSPGYLAAASRLCKDAGTLFVLDEVQTGLGRTGRLFAAEEEGLAVDALLLAKALGGGLVSLGACLCSAKAWSPDFGLYHSSTFANNHLSCSVGLAVLRRLTAGDQSLVREVREKGAHLGAGLETLVARYPDVFASTSGVGLMRAVHLAPWSGETSYFLAHSSATGTAVPLICGYLLNVQGIVTAPAFNHGRALRIEPPLTIERAEIDRMLAALDQVGDLIRRHDFATLLGYIVEPEEGIAPLPAHLDYSIPSHRCPMPPARDEPCLGRFAFLIHPTEFTDLVGNCRPPAFRHFNEEQNERWSNWVASWNARHYDPATVYHMSALRSRQGGYAEGWLIACPLTPAQMLRLYSHERAALMDKYMDLAKELSVDIVGLGAFTSIITRAGTEVTDKGVAVTTGNSLTAMASGEGLKQAALARGIDLSAVTTGVIGAAGSVGRLVCKNLVHTCGRMVLFGNPKNPRALGNLEALAGELYQDSIRRWRNGLVNGIGLALASVLRSPSQIPQGLCDTADTDSRRHLFELISQHFRDLGDEEAMPLQVTVELDKQLPRIKAVVSATSQGYSFLDPGMLSSGCIVCDVARPPDMLTSISADRDDILMFEGGLIKLPEPVRFGADNIIGLPDGITLACLSETITLAMSRVRGHRSIGSAVPIEEAQEIYRQARWHGFDLALPDHLVPDHIAAERAPNQGRLAVAQIL